MVGVDLLASRESAASFEGWYQGVRRPDSNEGLRRVDAVQVGVEDELVRCVLVEKVAEVWDELEEDDLVIVRVDVVCRLLVDGSDEELVSDCDVGTREVILVSKVGDRDV